jgi:hypothetical protein
VDLELIENNRERYKIYKMLGMKKYDEACARVMVFVSNYIDKYCIEDPNIEKFSIPRLKQIEIGVNSLKIYGDDVWAKAMKFYTASLLQLVYDPYHFGTSVRFAVEEKNKKFVVDKNSGIVHHFKAPNQLYRTHSVWYGHEAIHACKDIFYDEYRNILLYGDVLPIFHEMLTSGNLSNDWYNEWLKLRYYKIKKHNDDLKKYFMYKKEDKDNSEIYDMLISISGEYLTSFYYALILYRYYLDNEKKVLEQVIKVLKGKKTTYEMLKDLNILNKIVENDAIFIEENNVLFKSKRVL